MIPFWVSPVPLETMLRVALAVTLFTGGYLSNVLPFIITDPETIWAVYSKSIVSLVREVI